jgi:hypothetical protein
MKPREGQRKKGDESLTSQREREREGKGGNYVIEKTAMRVSVCERETGPLRLDIDVVCGAKASRLEGRILGGGR